jgi:WD40 repeat protein
LANQPGSVNSLTWNNTDALIFAGTTAGLREINVGKGTEVALGDRSDFTCVAFSPDHTYLAVATRAGFVSVFSLATSRFTRLLKRSSSNTSLAWSPDSTMLAVGGNDQLVDIISIQTKASVNKRSTGSSVNSLSWDPNGSGRLAIAQGDGTVHVWDTTQNTVRIGTGHNGAVMTVSWGHNYLASGSADTNVILWHV